MGDRFYGSPDLIACCAARGWSWRLRLKAHVLVTDRDGGETTLKDCFVNGDRLLLVVAIAVSWAVSTGMWDAQAHALAAEKSATQTARQGPPLAPLLVHKRPPPPDHLRRNSRQTTAPLDRMAN